MPLQVQDTGKLIKHIFTKNDNGPVIRSDQFRPLDLGIVVGGSHDGHLVIGFSDDVGSFVNLTTGLYLWRDYETHIRKLRPSEAVTLIVK